MGVHDLQVCTDAEVYAASLGEYMEEIAQYAALSSSSGGEGSSSSSRRQTKVMWLSMGRVDESQVSGWAVVQQQHVLGVPNSSTQALVLEWEYYRVAVHGHVWEGLRGSSAGTLMEGPGVMHILQPSTGRGTGILGVTSLRPGGLLTRCRLLSSHVLGCTTGLNEVRILVTCVGED